MKPLLMIKKFDTVEIKNLFEKSQLSVANFERRAAFQAKIFVSAR